jgi:hypothetical protein
MKKLPTQPLTFYQMLLDFELAPSSPLLGLGREISHHKIENYAINAQAKSAKNPMVWLRAKTLIKNQGNSASHLLHGNQKNIASQLLSWKPG